MKNEKKIHEKVEPCHIEQGCSFALTEMRIHYDTCVVERKCTRK